MKLHSYNKDIGLLTLRVGIGIMFILHALPKLQGGPAGWEKLALFGLPFLPEGVIAMLFGFTAMAAELLGGVFLAIGQFHRTACIALSSVMLVAFTTKLGNVSGISDFAKTAGWPLELIIVFVALYFAGPGRYTLGKAH